MVLAQEGWWKTPASGCPTIKSLQPWLSALTRATARLPCNLLCHVWFRDLLKPFAPPKVEASTIAGAKQLCPPAREPLQQIDVVSPLYLVVALVDEPSHRLHDPLRSTAELPHLGHEAAPFELDPAI